MLKIAIMKNKFSIVLLLFAYPFFVLPVQGQTQAGPRAQS